MPPILYVPQKCPAELTARCSGLLSLCPLLDRLLVAFKDPCDTDGAGRTTHFTGLAAGAFIFVNDYDISRLDTHNDFFIRGMPAGTHLGVSNLVYRTGCTAVPAARTEVKVDGDCLLYTSDA